MIRISSSDTDMEILMNGKYGFVEYESKRSTFRSERYQFTVIMPNLNYGATDANSDANDANSDANDADSGANSKKNKKLLIDNIKKRPNITQNELAGILSLSRRTVQRIIKELVNENKIKRVGSNRTGHWEIIG